MSHEDLIKTKKKKSHIFCKNLWHSQQVLAFSLSSRVFLHRLCIISSLLTSSSWSWPLSFTLSPHHSSFHPLFCSTSLVLHSVTSLLHSCTYWATVWLRQCGVVRDEMCCCHLNALYWHREAKMRLFIE